MQCTYEASCRDLPSTASGIQCSLGLPGCWTWARSTGRQRYRCCNRAGNGQKPPYSSVSSPVLATNPFPELHMKEIKEFKKGCLAMFSMLGYYGQDIGPVENWASQVADPFAKNNNTRLDGALDCSIPAFQEDAHHRGFTSCRIARSSRRWGGGGRDSQPHGQCRWKDHLHVDWPAMQENRVNPPAITAAEDREGTEVGGFAHDGATGRPDTTTRRRIFVNTGTNTIVIDLEAEHTSVDHVRAEVQEQDGITPDHQRLIYCSRSIS